MRSVGVGAVGCCWLFALACGGVYQRGGDEGGSGSSAGGSAAGSSAAGGSASSNPSRAGTGAAGAPVSAGHAGSASAAAGTAATIPTPHVALPCFNDTDCPGSGCGGEVCDWTQTHPQPVGEKSFVCTPASARNQGREGWCTTDANCKCAGVGARCVAPYCSFTLPERL